MTKWLLWRPNSRYCFFKVRLGATLAGKWEKAFPTVGSCLGNFLSTSICLVPSLMAFIGVKGINKQTKTTTGMFIGLLTGTFNLLQSYSTAVFLNDFALSLLYSNIIVICGLKSQLLIFSIRTMFTQACLHHQCL